MVTLPSTPTSVPPARRWFRLFFGILAALLLFAALLAGGGLFWLHHAMTASLPKIDGETSIPGLAAPVSVQRDDHGVPHIEASSVDDLLTAQGFTTAQDRLWQMDMLRRNAAGELAEILGRSALEHDRAQRVLQFRNVAQRIFNSLPEGDRHRYDEYAAGVNRNIEQNRDHLPAEFRLLHYRPRPWTGLDSIVIGLSMVQMLDTHWEAKLSRERIAARLHDAKLEGDLYPVGSWRDQPPTAAVTDMSQPHPAPVAEDDETDQAKLANPALPAGPGEDLNHLRSLLGLPACANCAPGSNNWVISGRHTASGKPLLSNDMHLPLSVPNIWYMADLNAPGLHAAGVTLPGVPLVIAGHNEHVAWGFTALYADVQDLYVEKLDGKGNYAGPDGSWLPLAHALETINVRFASPSKVDVQLTAHGPLLTPLFENERRPIALHWSLYDPALASIPLFEMNTAGNWQQFSTALGAWCFPTQNVVYADDQGHIAYHAIGKVPMRPAGLMAVPIEDWQHEWQGYIPFDNLPASVDPHSGLLATANSRVTPNDTKFPLTLEWVDPYRAERVYMMLRGRDKLTPADMLGVQSDIYSAVDQELAHRFAYAIDRSGAGDARLRQAADILRSWDGRVSTDSPAASIITRTRQAFWRLILEPKLGEETNHYNWAESNFAEEEIIMHGAAESGPASSKSTWLPGEFKDWDSLLTEAVRRSFDLGKAPRDLSEWKYGDWHVLDLEHPLYGLIPLVKTWAGTGEKPLSGDTTTIKQVGRAFGPSQRFTMDWSVPDSSTENIVLGESGNPASPWYRDQFADYSRGATFPFPFTASAVAASTRHTLRLLPENRVP